MNNAVVMNRSHLVIFALLGRRPWALWIVEVGGRAKWKRSRAVSGRIRSATPENVHCRSPHSPALLFDSALAAAELTDSRNQPRFRLATEQWPVTALLSDVHMFGM